MEENTNKIEHTEELTLDELPKKIKKEEVLEEESVIEEPVEEVQEEVPVEEPVHNTVRFTPIEADEPTEEEKKMYEETKMQELIKEEEKKQKEQKEQLDQEEIEKSIPLKTKLLVGTLIGLVVALLVAVGIWFYMDQREKKQAAFQKTYDSLSVTFTDASNVYEYGSEALDTAELVQEHTGTLKLSPESIAMDEVKDVKVIATVSEEDEYGEKAEKTFDYTISIQDTVPPEITLKEETVTITQEDSCDPQANVENVMDPVDGSLEYTQEPGENGGYTIETNLDVNTPGTYQVTVHAFDKHGNTAEASYSIRVKKNTPSYYRILTTDVYMRNLTHVYKSNTQEGGRQGNWSDLSTTLEEIYRSDKYEDRSSMLQGAASYVDENFEDLAEKNGSNTTSILGFKNGTVILYACEALDEDTNHMYYFFVIA